jgi:quercetin 2,3-dioxygenase
MWVYPSTYSLKPSWAKRHYPVETYTNKLLPIVLPEKSSNNICPLNIHQDVKFYISYISELASQKEIYHYLEQGRNAYIFIMTGKTTINNNLIMFERDAAKIISSSSVNISLKNQDTDSSNLLLIDLPDDKAR